jgi:hypothetical protein
MSAYYTFASKTERKVTIVVVVLVRSRTFSRKLNVRRRVGIGGCGQTSTELSMFRITRIALDVTRFNFHPKPICHYAVTRATYRQCLRWKLRLLRLSGTMMGPETSPTSWRRVFVWKEIMPLGTPCFCTATVFWLMLSCYGGPFDSALAESPGPAYEAVLDALQSGRTVRVLTSPSRCIDDRSGKPGAVALDGLQINAFSIVPNRGIFFFDTQEVLDDAGQPVTQFVRYNLDLDDQLAITVVRKTAAGVTRQDPLICQVPIGARFVW